MKANQDAQQTIKIALSVVRDYIKERPYRKLARHYNLREFKRVYLVHIRKTGGTSLNNMFFSLSGKEPERLYTQLAQLPDHRLVCNKLIFVGWNIAHINRGTYFYAFSHTPYHMLSLPDKTFTFTCFRDPVKRVISHYNMLMDFDQNEIDHPCMATEGKWLGDSFDDFLSRIPKEHLLNQLYMFSSSFDINEAVSNVQQLSHFFFGDKFNEGVETLNQKTGLDLQPLHIRKAKFNAQLSDNCISLLRERLQDEYRFIDRLKDLEMT